MVVVRCKAEVLSRVDKVAAATKHSRSVVVQEALAAFCAYLESETYAHRQEQARHDMLQMAERYMQEKHSVSMGEKS